MGLDIYFRLYKKTRERNEGESIYEYKEDLAKSANASFIVEAKKAIKEGIAKMEEAIKNDKFSSYLIINFKYDMKKYFPYDFERRDLENAKTVDDVEAWAKKIDWNLVFKPEDAYFRKVNCIYAYFSERLEDETCIVTKDDILEIIDRATRILANKGNVELAKNLLPTQSGFFFGSTEYDEWYYQDMVSILTEFGKLLSNWKDNDLCFVYMSW